MEKQLPFKRLTPNGSDTLVNYVNYPRQLPLKYTCAFNGNPPAMIRVLMRIVDPGNRLADGQWHEFVLTR